MKVSKEVNSKEKAQVMGYEWSLDNDRSKKRSKTWLYALQFEGESLHFVATEEELLAWNGL